MLTGEQLFKDVIKYFELGPHMTGTPGDLATSGWIAAELEKAGLNAKLQNWPLRQFFIKECSLSIDGNAVDSFPFWYPKTTGSGPVTGPLAKVPEDRQDADLKGYIAFVSSRISGTAIYGGGVNDMAEKAAAAGALGLVVVAGSVSREVPAINARKPYHQNELPLPAVIAAMKDEAFLGKAASYYEKARITLSGENGGEPRSANVVGTIRRGPEWIVISTPISGWFGCAGERGPGVALFLALARWAAAGKLRHRFLFLGNSGHELDNMGAHLTHLNLVGTKNLMPILKPVFRNIEGYRPRSSGFTAGELATFIKAGYRAFGFFGGHPFFHTRQDMPQTSGPEFLEPVALALVDAIERIAADA